jgi:hypothetical protein
MAPRRVSAFAHAHAQVLLTIGSKYDMPVLLHKAGQFLQANAQQLDSSPSSEKFAWKWVLLAEQRGLHTAAQACIEACLSQLQQMALGELPNAGPAEALLAIDHMVDKEVLSGMSAGTCQHLTAALAQGYSSAVSEAAHHHHVTNQAIASIPSTP